MLKIHKNAKPLIVTDNGKDVQIGWEVKTRDFKFQAVNGVEGSKAVVTTYADWGEDMQREMMNHASWEDAKRHLDTLLQTSQR